ncbi:M3 family oligoendopeptidase [Patescibacteria group bacterium]|nr:M3 family oligoendopeptidase [Patescibacteria group bacterium]
MSTLPRWNLEDLFASPTDPAIEQTFLRASEMAKDLVTDFKGKLPSLEAAAILDLLQRYENALQTITKPVAYASLRHATDTRDAEREGFQRRTRARAVSIERDLLWVDLELAQLPEATLNALLVAPEVAPYKHVLEKILASKPHQLSEAQEQLIADLEQTSGRAFATLFEQEDSTKLYTFKQTQRTCTDLLKDLKSPDRETRHEAADAISAGLQEEEQRRSFIYTTLIKHKETLDRYRAFAIPEASQHLANETTAEAVEAMALAVEAHTGSFQRYYQWKAKKLGIETLTDYDRYAPLSNVEKTYTFDEARAMILRAFERFSPVFSDLAKKFFDNGWIDAEPAPGKRGGAFCSYVSADLHPYVFVNFQGNINDVLTLAHELGHAIHASLARPNGYLQFDTPLTLAETASVFGEMLTFDLLRNELTDPKDRQALMAHKIESIFATVFRQITLYRFEQKAHTHVRANGFATPETYHKLWEEVHTSLFGNALTVTPGYRRWWSYISHFFYVPFYVYAYSFGELLTCCLYEQSQHNPEAFREKYIAFLSRGGSANPATLLAPLGINPESTETWAKGLDWIDQLIEETIQLG